MTPARFKAIRLSMGLTQAALSKVIGLSIRQISRYETGAVSIDITHALALKGLEVEIDG